MRDALVVKPVIRQLSDLNRALEQHREFSTAADRGYEGSKKRRNLESRHTCSGFSSTAMGASRTLSRCLASKASSPASSRFSVVASAFCFAASSVMRAIVGSTGWVESTGCSMMGFRILCWQNTALSIRSKSRRKESERPTQVARSQWWVSAGGPPTRMRRSSN